MINFYCKVSGLLLLFFLFSCTAHHPHLIQAKVKVISPCQAACLQQWQDCQQQCNDSCTACKVKANHQTFTPYLQYIGQKKIQGGYLYRNLQSYHDPLQCRKASCDCRADLSACQQSCTGVVQKRWHSVPYC